jgi:hypothetical protein
MIELERPATAGALFRIDNKPAVEPSCGRSRPTIWVQRARPVVPKDGKSKLVSIRTTQDTWIAFPRDKSNTRWVTLSDVDAVVAVSVDDPHDPKFANVHMIDGNEMRFRFDRAYAARLKAGHTIPVGRGVWVSLYIPESNAPPAHVGAGAGLKHPPFATVPLEPSVFATKDEEVADEAIHEDHTPLTIAEAKRRLALTFGVDPSNIRITEA